MILLPWSHWSIITISQVFYYFQSFEAFFLCLSIGMHLRNLLKDVSSSIWASNPSKFKDLYIFIFQNTYLIIDL